MAREFIAEGQDITAADIRLEEIPEGSSISFLAENAFDGVAEGSIIARVNLAAGTILTPDLIAAVNSDGSEVQTGERRVTFSIEIPGQGFAAGQPSAGTRVLLIQFLPAVTEGDRFMPREINPVQVEVVQGITGGRVTFLAIPERATRLQVAQLQITERGGYIFLWEVPPGYNEETLLAQARDGFNQAVFG